MKESGYREVAFWILLLGSWQFLSAPGHRAGIIGTLGSVTFLMFAWSNLDRLNGLGLNHACWRSATRTNWVLAGLIGIVAGIGVFVIAAAASENMKLSDDWKLITLQVTLGPVLEEVVFRGYLFAFMTWAFNGMRNHLLVALAALIFAAIHLAQPGVSWLQLVCITSTGTLYGWIRCRSGSTGPAAVSHAAYNLTLYAITNATT
jgi:hypothetical protein